MQQGIDPPRRKKSSHDALHSTATLPPFTNIAALLFDVVHTLHATSFNRAECTVLKINLCPSTSCAAAAHTVPHHQRLTCELGPMLLTRSPKQMGGHIFEGYMTEKSLKNEERRNFNKYEIRSHL